MLRHKVQFTKASYSHIPIAINRLECGKKSINGFNSKDLGSDWMLSHALKCFLCKNCCLILINLTEINSCLLSNSSLFLSPLRKTSDMTMAMSTFPVSIPISMKKAIMLSNSSMLIVPLPSTSNRLNI